MSGCNVNMPPVCSPLSAYNLIATVAPLKHVIAATPGTIPLEAFMTS